MSIRIANGMGKLMFNKAWSEAMHFIKDGSRHCSEAVPTYLIFANEEHRTEPACTSRAQLTWRNEIKALTGT